ncbi:MAG: hypothetical protein NTV46_20360 [Verrucomicrobia bacterium]|nr:hypothetical protein [Verrucomicrobiota bacterium]
MKLRFFVSGSSVILVGWLAVTFMVHVPAQRYLRPGKYPVSAVPKNPSMADNVPTGKESAGFSIFASR